MKNDIVITGFGLLTPAGKGLAENCEAILKPIERSGPEDYCLDSFKPAPHMSDRRMLKAILKGCSFGLVSIEDAKKSCNYDAIDVAPEKIGLYTGTPPTTPLANEPYFSSMQETTNIDGDLDVRQFGETFKKSRPITLLVGLPNNMLCYGSIILDARGPNSNYTGLDTSGHQSVKTLADNISRGKLELGLAGGYSQRSDKISVACDKKNELSLETVAGERHVVAPYDSKNSGTIMADGAASIILELREGAEKRATPIIAQYINCVLASDALGPVAQVSSDESLAYCMQECLEKSDVSSVQVGLVFTTGCGIANLDDWELSAVNKVFTEEKPALAVTSRAWGHMTESGGIGEVGLANWLYRERQETELPETLKVSGVGFKTEINRDKPYVMILRTSPQGDYSALLIKV